MHLRELSSRVLRKLRPQTLKNSDPLDVSKTETSRKPQIPEKLRSQGVLKTQTLNIFQILQLSIDREQPLFLSFPSTGAKFRFTEISPERNFALAKFWQNQFLLTVCNETLCSDRYV